MLEIPYSSFIEMRVPFVRYHLIHFKPDSQAYKVFGENIYGKFISPKWTCKIFDEESILIQIDAPGFNEYNPRLSAILRTALYFKGVRFTDLDLTRTYPFAEVEK